MNNAFSVPIYSLSESKPELISPLGEGQKGLFVLVTGQDWQNMMHLLAKFSKPLTLISHGMSVYSLYSMEKRYPGPTWKRLCPGAIFG